jgi:hypothetical protein
MAKKPSITTIASGYYSRNALNTNFENLRDQFDNTLSLDGSTPNAMQADLDMNSNDILNANTVNVNALTIGGVVVAPAEVQLSTTFATQNYVGNGSTVTYSMGFNPATKANVDVYIDGVYQNQDAFNISGTNLTFTAAPPLNSAIEIKVPVNVTDLVASNSTEVTYSQGGLNSVSRSVESRLRDLVSVKDFGAVGDGVTDDTTAIQAAIDAAQDGFHLLYMPAGKYKITATLLINGSKPLTLHGAGRSTFSGSTLLEEGTVVKLATQNISAFDVTTGLAVTHFSNFTVQNISGGSNEIAFGNANGRAPYFGYFADLTISGFEHAFKYQRALYLRFDRMIIRNCDYGIDCWQFTGTPPYTLNDTGPNGYFNNVITVRDCQIILSTVAYRLAGACIDVRNCDASSYTSAGFVFGGDDFPNGTVSADQLYVEAGTGTSVTINRMAASIGTVFLGSTSDTIGLDVTSAQVTVDNLRGYPHPNLGIKNTDGYVAVLGGFSGSIAPKFQNFGTGVTRLIRDEGVRQVSATIADTQFVDIPTEGSNDRTYALDVFGLENGISNYGFRIIQRGASVYIIGTKPANLTVSTQLSVSGNRNVRIQNTAGFPYTFSVFVNYAPSFYSVPL